MHTTCATSDDWDLALTSAANLPPPVVAAGSLICPSRNRGRASVREEVRGASACGVPSTLLSLPRAGSLEAGAIVWKVASESTKSARSPSLEGGERAPRFVQPSPWCHSSPCREREVPSAQLACRCGLARDCPSPLGTSEAVRSGDTRVLYRRRPSSHLAQDPAHG